MTPWFEELPEQCPPIESYSPNGQAFYRLCRDFIPCDADFHSHRILYPGKNFSVTECRARSVSVYDSRMGAEKKLKVPALRGKKVVEVILHQEDGLIQQTGEAGHYSWWRSIVFDVENCYIRR